MVLKIEAFGRLQKQRTPIEEAVDWLCGYYMDPNYYAAEERTIKAIVDRLKPLIEVAPYKPVNKKLYRVISKFREGEFKGTLKPNQAHSLTWCTTEKEWDDIAGRIGLSHLDDWYVVEVQDSVMELCNTEWIVNKVRPWVKKNLPDHLYFLDDQVTSQRSEKEVIAFSRQPIKAKVVYRDLEPVVRPKRTAHDYELEDFYPCPYCHDDLNGDMGPTVDELAEREPREIKCMSCGEDVYIRDDHGHIKIGKTAKDVK